MWDIDHQYAIMWARNVSGEELMAALSKLQVSKQRQTVLVQPKLWCQVRGMQRTPAGMLRTPVFLQLYGPAQR